MDIKEQNTFVYNNQALGFQKKFDHVGYRARDVEKAFHLVNKKNPKVLELGCAHGREAAGILKKTINYIGIDIAPELIKIAKKNNPSGEFLVADLETYEFPSNLDIIFAFASLLHSNKTALKKVISRAYHSLNSNGIFHISIKKRQVWRV